MTNVSDKRVRVVQRVGDVSRTKQSFASEADVNAIMRKYASTGVLPPGAAENASYGDFSSVLEYHEAMNRVRAAEDAFGRLPSRVRDHVGNDPGKFLEMILDPSRSSEVEELGLFAAPAAPSVPPVVEEPVEAPDVSDPPIT